MNKLIYKILPVLFVLFVSCEQDDTTDGVSRITYFPEMELIGDALIISPIGTAFTDPGIIATAGGEPIEYTASIGKGRWSGNDLDTNVADYHTITYSALNEDGIPGTLTREVYVSNTGDLTTSIEGVYLSDTERGNSESYENLSAVMIIKTGPNTYMLTHGIGGYYDLGRNYLDLYFVVQGAIITVNNLATNDITVTDAHLNNPWWGDNPFSISDFTVDASTKTITFTASGFSDFNVTLVQQ